MNYHLRNQAKQTNTILKTGTRAFLAGFICLVFLLQAAGLSPVGAQNQPGDWTPPINISNAGSSVDPRFVVDETGISHVIWFDEFAGARYAHSTEEGGWSAPVSVRFPFDINRPLLVRGVNNTTAAFWLDNRQTLTTSRVMNSSFGESWSWSKPVVLAQRVLAYDVAVEADGTYHLVYLNIHDTVEAPSGIYHRRSFPGRENWSKENLIYPSLYLRGVTSLEANINIAVGNSEEGDIYISWDEQPLSKVYFSRSLDKGANWDAPLIIDQLSEETGAGLPFGIDVTTWNEQVTLVWKRGNANSSCTLLFQSSADQGESWSGRDVIAGQLSGCAANASFLSNREEALYWQGTIREEVYLAAWDGTRWSEPQIQPGLSSTLDPATNRLRRLGCWDIQLPPEQNTLHAVGCDIDGNEDVWFSTKPLGDLRSWFPTVSLWKKPARTFDIPAEPGPVTLLADNDGRLHKLWLQTQETESGTTNAIHYAGWDGTAWGKPVAVIQPQAGTFGHLSAVVSDAGILYAAWEGNQSGEIYFSWAKASSAHNAAEWTQPVALPEPVKISRSPVIMARQGTIYIAYAIPINEKRGIYLTSSTDEGKTWSEPALVFDAQAAGWEMADKPSMAITFDGQIHLLWMRETLPGTKGAQGLYYARSADRGARWSAAESVTDGNVLWGKVIASATGTLYQVWQEGGSENIVRSRRSESQGSGWDSTQALAGTGETYGLPALIADPAGKLYLLRFFKDPAAILKLEIWETQSSRWVTGDQASPVEVSDITIGNFTGVVSPAGLFAVVYAAAPLEPAGGLPQNSFYFTSRPVELPAELPTPPVITVVPGSEEVTPTEPEPTEEPTNTPAPALGEDPNQELSTAPAPQDNTMQGIILSIGVSGLIVAIGFIILITRNRLR